VEETILNTELTKDNPWKIIHLLSEELDRRFTITEICDLWDSLYGGNMRDEYPKFVDELEQRIS
jgi:hypothetical protein